MYEDKLETDVQVTAASTNFILKNGATADNVLWALGNTINPEPLNPQALYTPSAPTLCTPSAPTLCSPYTLNSKP